jgi:hypothetical protein
MNNNIIIDGITWRGFSHANLANTPAKVAPPETGLLIADEILTMSRLLRGRRKKGVAL